MEDVCFLDLRLKIMILAVRMVGKSLLVCIKNGTIGGEVGENLDLLY
jgi:hypothetical protein